MQRFDMDILSKEDFRLACGILGPSGSSKLCFPDLVIAPTGEPYIYRWELVRFPSANIYLHVQVASDPARPLHDHPWDNFSNILSGGYDERWCPNPHLYDPIHAVTRRLRKGDTCYRKGSEAHRLLLPPEFPYTMSLFSTGPKVREWGFWYEDGWRSFKEVTHLEDNVSVHHDPEVVT